MVDDAAVRDAEAFTPAMIAYLDSMALPDVSALLHPPMVETRIQSVPGAPTDPDERAARGRWLPGDHRPSLADEDPAVNAAMARCAVARWRTDRTYGDLARTVSHPERCGWCDYPTAELMRALDWASHYGRFIESEAYIWHRGHSAYRRDSGRAGIYENPTWQTFATLSAREQRYLVDRAVEASRANLEPIARPEPRDHLPWCDLRPDHAGDCPAPPDEPEDPT